jgi:hypothetical protein
MLETWSGDLNHARFIGAAPGEMQLSEPWAIRQTLFRLSFTLPQPLPANLSCVVRVSAATRYRLYVNGEPVEGQEDFYRKLWKTTPGDEMAFLILRASRLEVIKLRSVDRYQTLERRK